MTQRFLKIGAAGFLEEDTAITMSAGADSAGLIPALAEDGRLDISFIPPNVIDVLASENILKNNLVNIYNNSGVLNVRKANASVASRYATGFVIDNFNQGDVAMVHLSGVITELSGLTVGATEFLSNVTAGAMMETVVATSEHYVQEVGVAITASSMIFRPRQAIKRA